MTTLQPIAHGHFPRLWAARHDDRVTEYPKAGFVSTPAWRRAQLRALIRMMRREKTT